MTLFFLTYGKRNQFDEIYELRASASKSVIDGTTKENEKGKYA
jgi:hypothetical protein